MKIYDKYGVERDLGWLHAEFGPLEITDPYPQDPEGPQVAWAIAELHETDDLHHAATGGPRAKGPGGEYLPPLDARARSPLAGINAPASTLCAVLDPDGRPLPGIEVVFWYSTAPALPGAGWHEQGDSGATKDEPGLPGHGTVGFAMGGGAYYDPYPEGPGGPQTKGPHDLWVHAKHGPCQLLSGLGMIAGTSHRHLDVVIQQTGPGMPPYPGPDLPAAVKALCACRSQLAWTQALLKSAGRHAQDALDALGRTCRQ